MVRASVAVAAVVAGLGVVLAPVASASGPYSSCGEAAADGVYNIPEGDSNYWPGGDRDKDGIACEA